LIPAREGTPRKLRALAVGLVALRPNPPAQSGRHEGHERGFWPAPARRSARRDGSQREPFQCA